MRSATVKRSGHLAIRLADIRADTDEPQQSGNRDAPERGLGFESTLFLREQAYLDLFRQAAILRIGHNPSSTHRSPASRRATQLMVLLVVHTVAVLTGLGHACYRLHWIFQDHPGSASSWETLVDGMRPRSCASRWARAQSPTG